MFINAVSFTGSALGIVTFLIQYMTATAAFLQKFFPLIIGVFFFVVFAVNVSMQWYYDHKLKQKYARFKSRYKGQFLDYYTEKACVMLPREFSDKEITRLIELGFVTCKINAVL